MGTPLCILQNIMPYREFREWAVFAQRFPIGDEAQQILLANFYATYINAHLKTGAQKVKPGDLLPFRPKHEERDEMSMDDKWKRMLGGFDPAKGKPN